MPAPQQTNSITPQVLATDLDGTLIPLDGNQQNRIDLETLRQQLTVHRVGLLFVTGRHLDSVRQAIDQHALPVPDFVICDVGTSIYRRSPDGRFELVESYVEHLERICAELPVRSLQQLLAHVPGLQLQEPEKQGQYKLSFYTDRNELGSAVDRIREVLDEAQAPWSTIHSIDPFTDDGLIDVLPSQVSKASALDWWMQIESLTAEHIVFAGDSGNDLAALTAGYHAILVGNADRELARQISAVHEQSSRPARLHLSTAPATSGVLEGCRMHGLFPGPHPAPELPGATCVPGAGTRFRVWAPRHKSVSVRWENDAGNGLQPLTKTADGWFQGTIRDCCPGTLYRYRLDDAGEFPDPASRAQPEGVHGPSEVVDSHRYVWSDWQWRGVDRDQLVIYEVHVGSWTTDGTFRAAIARLPELKQLGITALELMPIAQSSGRWNWGYDGVNLFAPRNSYGTPDDLKALVDACHAAGIAVILDVVYNHLGPEGNYLRRFGPYFSRRHRTPWGEAFNFDGRQSAEVRRYIVDNALYWLREYHFDGLRLDSVHAMHDDSEFHIVSQLCQSVSSCEELRHRKLHLIAESNVYDERLLAGGDQWPGCSAIWCDCLMHSIYSVARPELMLAPRKYEGLPDIATSLSRGFIYAGAERQRQAVPSRAGAHDQPASSRLNSLVVALQNHDVVGNHPRGLRIHQLASVEFQRAAAALVLLSPTIPLIFMGEDSASEAPFAFFADHENPTLRRAVDRGRRREHPQHDWHGALPPSDAKVFSQSCIESAARDDSLRVWYRKLIELRHQGRTLGWLTPSRLRVSFRPEQGSLCLRYRYSGSEEITVHVRLAQDGHSDTPPVAITNVRQVLLDSRASSPDFRPNQSAPSAPQLVPNHVLVCRSATDCGGTS